MVASKRKHTRRAQAQRTAFFDEGKRLDADPETRHLADCWICETRIDYSVEPNSTEDSHNLDHALAVDDYPELQDDPENFRHSHRRCNGSRGKRDLEAGLGEQVEDWW